MIGNRPRHTGAAAPRQAPTAGGRRAHRVPFALLITGLVLGGMALLLMLNTFSAANELQRHDLALRDEAIAAQVEQLRNEVAASAAPANLASAAAALGMVPAGNPAFVVDVAGKLIIRGEPAPVPYPVVPLPTTSTPAPTHPATSTPAGPAKRTSASPKATTTDTSTAARTTSAKQASHKHTSHEPTARRTASSTPAAPSPTPTPTVTLPGGPR